ncbi:MAG: 1-deoxy-D-xylulose-5-phosphate reductoisomerase [Clostridiales bacterium]|nr:1-deoxy-D-xylulose-5-phosphate reductoisomerase [Clostridiales bacterium]
MKNISVLGSTGSIGKQTLDVIRAKGNRLKAYALCADSNAALLAEQANEFMPKVVGIANGEKYSELKEKLSYSPEIIVGKNAACDCGGLDEVDLVINAVSGVAGFEAIALARWKRKLIASANKESLIYLKSILTNPQPLIHWPCGDLAILPIDSEQSAIFQLIEGDPDIENNMLDRNKIESIILTASGGPFYNMPIEKMCDITVEDALKHPTWNMGKKITIDSATLFNKGLEILEAACLFGLKHDKIEVVIHPQSVVHSMVRFTDGNVKALMSVPDMRGAIQYALTYPRRRRRIIDRLDFSNLNLSFSAPDCEKFPAIRLAYDALREGRILPIVYTAANEAAVELFVKNQTGFLDISKRVEYAMNKTYTCKSMTIDAIMNIDRLARIYATEWRDSV